MQRFQEWYISEADDVVVHGCFKPKFLLYQSSLKCFSFCRGEPFIINQIIICQAVTPQ